MARRQPEDLTPVLLHGFTGSSASWGDAIIDGLAARAGAPLLVDLPGHGAAHGTDLDEISLESALLAIERAGRWPADLIGYSMGGRLALHFAVSRPGLVRRLVLESASPGLETSAERAERREADELWAQRIAGDFTAFVDDWAEQPIFESQARLDPSVRARQRQIRLMNDPGSLAASLRALGTGALPSLWDRLPGLDLPTLLVVGELDAKFVALNRRMVAALPTADCVVVAGAGHTVHLEQPAAWLGAVTAFLSGDDR